jgi:hypothetical protein
MPKETEPESSRSKSTDVPKSEIAKNTARKQKAPKFPSHYDVQELVRYGTPMDELPLVLVHEYVDMTHWTWISLMNFRVDLRERWIEAMLDQEARQYQERKYVNL